MIPAIRNWTRDEMTKRVAFFRDLKGSKTGLPIATFRNAGVN
jgi:hypothetical protein